MTEYEEILGYHFEQAYRYRSELGPLDDDRRSTRAVAAARHLGAAGQRALLRGDIRAATKLLRECDRAAASRGSRTLRLVADLSSALGNRRRPPPSGQHADP